MLVTKLGVIRWFNGRCFLQKLLWLLAYLWEWPNETSPECLWKGILCAYTFLSRSNSMALAASETQQYRFNSTFGRNYCYDWILVRQVAMNPTVGWDLPHSRINIPIWPYPLFFSPSPSINLIIMCVHVWGQGPCLVHLGIIQGLAQSGCLRNAC